MQKLSRAINNSEVLAGLEITSTSEGSTLAVTCPEDLIALRGSENGLGIPPPPKNFLGVLDAASRTVHLFWENPPGGYDSILGTESGGFLFRLSGDWESCDDPIPYDTGAPSFRATRHYTLIGCRNGTPSDVATCNVEICQEILDLMDGSPHVDGVAPGWRQWDHNQGTATMAFTRGPVEGNPYQDADGQYPPGY